MEALPERICCLLGECILLSKGAGRLGRYVSAVPCIESMDKVVGRILLRSAPVAEIVPVVGLVLAGL